MAKDGKDNMSTYMDLYVGALEERIQSGGKQEDVDTAFAEYNAFKPEAFQEWLEGAGSIACGQCGALFKPEGKKATDAVLCPEHTP